MFEKGDQNDDTRPIEERRECRGTHPGHKKPPVRSKQAKEASVGGHDSKVDSYIVTVPSPTTDSPRILAVRFGALGDLVLTTPLFRAIRVRHPKAHLALVTKTEYLPLFRHNPRLTEVIPYDTEQPLAPLARRLKEGDWTHRLDLHQSLRSRTLRVLAGGRWTGYPKHRLQRSVLVRTKKNIYRDTRPVVERYFDAARGLDVKPDGGPPEIFIHTEATQAADRFLKESALARDRSLVAVAPGAGHATKRWPERHWHELVRLLINAKRDVVILGGSDEQAVASRLAEAGGDRAASAAGLFDIQGSAALLRRARTAVAGDTGLMHLATAVGTPIVVLLGPTVGPFGFLPYGARSTVLEKELDCRPCSTHGSVVCPLGHHHCLELIHPHEVAEALRKLPQ